jgi:hypothetical protein
MLKLDSPYCKVWSTSNEKIRRKLSVVKVPAWKRSPEYIGTEQCEQFPMRKGLCSWFHCTRVGWHSDTNSIAELLCIRGMGWISLRSCRYTGCKTKPMTVFIRKGDIIQLWGDISHKLETQCHFLSFIYYEGAYQTHPPTFLDIKDQEDTFLTSL